MTNTKPPVVCCPDSFSDAVVWRYFDAMASRVQFPAAGVGSPFLHASVARNPLMNGTLFLGFILPGFPREGCCSFFLPKGGIDR